MRAWGREDLIRHHTPHALANNRNFNREEFANNATSMMSQFAQFHLSQINSGINVNDALRASMNFMGSGMFGMTTSVNNLSFNDFLLVQNTFLGGFSSSTTAEGLDAERNRLNAAFNNNPQLSGELRALLGT